MKIVTVEQMQAMEVAAGKAGVSADVLMEKAGLAVAGQAMQRLASPRGAKILVLVFIILFIQKRPRGLFPQKGRAAEA